MHISRTLFPSSFSYAARLVAFDLVLFEEKEVSMDASWSSLLAACNSPILLSISAMQSFLSLFQVSGNQHNCLLLTCFSKYTVRDAADANLKSRGPGVVPCSTSQTLSHLEALKFIRFHLSGCTLNIRHFLSSTGSVIQLLQYANYKHRCNDKLIEINLAADQKVFFSPFCKAECFILMPLSSTVFHHNAM